MPNEWSAIWSKDGKLKNEGCKYLPAPEGMKASVKVVDGKEEMHISGYASTSAVDSYNEIILPSAFEKWLPDFFKSPMLLFMHDWFGMPIGKVQEARIDSTGLYVDAVIYATEMGKDVMLLITKNVLNAFSVGFIPMKWEMDEETNIITHTEVRLMELSVVNRGANPLSLFQEAKTAGVEMALRSYIINNEIKKDVPCTAGVENSNRRFSKMSEINMTELEKKFASADVAGSLAGDVAKVTKSVDAINSTITQLADQVKLGNPDVMQQVKRASDDVLALRKDLDEIKAAQKIVGSRIEYSDWRALDDSTIYMKTDSGLALPQVYQRAYRLFNLPVESKSADGQRLRTLRDLHDTCVLLRAAGIKTGFDWRNTKTARLFFKEVEAFDEMVFKAMYSTGTGVGDEWVPTEMSANFQEFYRMQPRLESFLEQFDMPSNPYLWPIGTGGATAYKLGEPAVNNPVQVTASNIASSQITFTAYGVAVRVASSTELIEDSIVAIAPLVLKELAFCQSDTWEDVFINGDATATHRDTGTSLTSSSSNPITYLDGLREIAEDLSNQFDVASTSAGVGDAAATYGQGDLRYCRKLLGVLGSNAADCLYIVSTAGHYHALGFTVFQTASTSGLPLSSLITGTFDRFDGAPLYVSPKFRDDLNASGIFDDSTKTKTIVACIHRPSFKIGNRRSATVEVAKDILTQQWNWVSTSRRSFKNMQPSSRLPVAVGYNVPN